MYEKNTVRGLSQECNRIVVGLQQKRGLSSPRFFICTVLVQASNRRSSAFWHIHPEINLFKCRIWRILNQRTGKGDDGMQAFSRSFDCAKCIVLGALYDSLERLHWELVSANSDAGILTVSPPKTDSLFLVRVQPIQTDRTEVIVELASGSFYGPELPEKSAEALLETLTQITKGALCGKQGSPDAHE